MTCAVCFPKNYYNFISISPEPGKLNFVPDSQAARELAAGATEVVPEIFEGSLMLGSHALVLLGVPLPRVPKGSPFEEFFEEFFTKSRNEAIATRKFDFPPALAP
jgi:hypothetical protein